MRRIRSTLLLLLVPAVTLSAQEYEYGASFNNSSIAYAWKDASGSGTGPRPALAQEGGSVSTPFLFGDVNAPFPVWNGFLVTANAGLRYALGSDVSEISYGLGVARLIPRGFVGIRYMDVGTLNVSVLGNDWGLPERGFQLLARRGDWRADLMRTGHTSRAPNFGGDDVRKNSITMLSLRYKFLGARVEQWVDRNTLSNGYYNEFTLNRVSVFAAFGAHVGKR